MDIRFIRNDEDLQWALNEVDQYFESEPAEGSQDADRFEILSLMIDAYEREHFPIERLDPVAAIETMISSFGRTREELIDVLGSKSRASEILGRKRHLSIDMIRKLSEEWKIPLEILTRSYELATPRKNAVKGSSVAEVLAGLKARPKEKADAKSVKPPSKKRRPVRAPVKGKRAA